MVFDVRRPSSPVGSSTRAAAHRRASRSAAYRVERDRVADYAAVAKLVIHRRAALGITQRELARRIGTKESAISRLESGRHATNVATLRRVFAGLGGHLVVGYEVPRSDRGPRQRELVAV